MFPKDTEQRVRWKEHGMKKDGFILSPDAMRFFFWLALYLLSTAFLRQVFIFAGG